MSLKYSKTVKNAEWTKYKMLYKLSKNGGCSHGIKLWYQSYPFSDWTHTKRTCISCDVLYAKATVEIFICETELENMAAERATATEVARIQAEAAEAAPPKKKKKAFTPPPGGFPKRKKLTKAERRELQDKQRAAKAAVTEAAEAEATAALATQPRQVQDMSCSLNGVQGKYTGTVNASGKRHSKGVACYDNGGKYDGEWEGDKQHGRGVQTWASGNQYTGEFKDGNIHGRGVYTWANGRKYNGEWEGGKVHGHGVYIWASGDVYDGDKLDG